MSDKLIEQIAAAIKVTLVVADSAHQRIGISHTAHSIADVFADELIGFDRDAFLAAALGST